MATTVGMTHVFPGVAAETNAVFGHEASSLQSGITVANGAIAGTLKYVSEGALPGYWGAGNFIALKFTGIDAADAAKVKVGIEPTAGVGLLPLDSDLNAVFKVTHKDLQDIVLVASDATGRVFKQRFDLSGLTCEEAE